MNYNMFTVWHLYFVFGYLAGEQELISCNGLVIRVCLHFYFWQEDLVTKQEQEDVKKNNGSLTVCRGALPVPGEPVLPKGGGE